MNEDYNDLYNRTIQVNGRVYHYDPDRDIYYPRNEPLSLFDRWAWVATIVILSVLVYCTA
jgi:hypothetical protein